MVVSYFLEHVAEELLRTFGTDLSKVTVVFPNKRASLFLNEHLARQCDKPIWSPSYTTISDLFRSQSSLQVADPIKLICDLYKSFISCTGLTETLDHFYGWGEILLADFDDVDKQLAPADKVFANLRDIHEFDDDSYLTEQQREIIRKFFSHFNEDHHSELKQRFLALWSHLYDIYLDFNARLKAQGLAYEGALYREVVTKDSVNERNYTVLEQKYVFVGFNLLHPVEQALIDSLGTSAMVIRDNDEETPKDITVISAPTNNIQARYVSTWLKENQRIEAGSKTAIVLADESLLQTVIHCLPPEVTKINITTGYPLSQTATTLNCKLSTVNCPLELRSLATEGTQELSTLRSSSARLLPKGHKNSPLELEAHYRLQLILNRLQALIDSGDLQVNDATLQRLLTQIIASTTIPFHGEPLEGIQVMGVLETRNLDFDHVLLLSCNEGNIPKGINDTSFIPYSIRKAYNLTTIDHKVAIYHHYFRRLLQRAQDVTLVYNNATSDGKTGEMSQFILRLLIESPHPITFKTLQAGQQPSLHQPQPITKTEAVIQRLQQMGTLSPSALSRYLRCPLQFFYHYVAGLEEYEDEDERIDNRLFGNIFHKAAQLLYEKIIHPHTSIITTEAIEEVLKTKIDIERAVDAAIKIELFHIEDPMATMPPLNGLQLINREVIIRYVRQLLGIDRRLAPFTILGLEQKVSIPLSSLFPSRSSSLPSSFLLPPSSSLIPPSSSLIPPSSFLLPPSSPSIGGVIDRLDKITLPDGSGRIRVVDYKTGSGYLKPLPDVASIFDPACLKNHSDYYLQTFLYAIITDRSLATEGTQELSTVNSQLSTLNSQLSARAPLACYRRDARTLNCQPSPLSPCLLFIQHAGADDYDPTLIIGKTPVTDINDVKEEFLEHLHALLSEIFDPERPFLPTEDKSKCQSCPFKRLCH